MSLLRVNTIRNKDGIGNPDFDRGISVSSGISTIGNVRIAPVGTGATIGSASTIGVVTYYGDGSNLTGVSNFNIVNQGLSTTTVFPTFARTVGLTTIGIVTTQIAFIPSSGNFGIGVTNPTSKLHVNGTVNISGTSAISTTSSTTALRITQLGTGNALVVEDSASTDSSPFVVNNVGDVGIGTPNPSNKLDVFGGNIRNFGTTSPSFIVTPTTGSSYIFGANTALSGAGIYDNTGGAWRLVVQDTTGNIGIGSTIPTSRLDVVGDTEVTGNAYVSGKIGIAITNPTEALQIGTGVTIGTTGIVSATKFVGNLEGNATSANSATSSLSASGVSLSVEKTSTSAHYLTYSSSPINNQLIKTDDRANYLTYTPSSGSLSARSISVGTIVSASNLDITAKSKTFDLEVIGISTLGSVRISSGIVTSTTSTGIVTYYGDGSKLTNSRTTVSGNTGSIASGASSNISITGFKTYSLLKVGISHAAWVVLYTNSSSRTSDSSRNYLTDPTPGSGVIAEVRTTTSGISTFIMSPGVIGWNDDTTVGTTIYAKVVNNEASTVSTGITVTLTVVKLEG